MGRPTDSSETARAQRSQLLFFLGMLATLVALVAGVVLVLWDEARKWGSLPPTTGSGVIPYGGLTVAFVVCMVAAFAAWRQWAELSCK